MANGRITDWIADTSEQCRRDVSISLLLTLNSFLGYMFSGRPSVPLSVRP